MRRPKETVRLGRSLISDLAAICRSNNLYSTGSDIEHKFGERRTWTDTGATAVASFPALWFPDQARDCNNHHLTQAYSI